MLFAKFNIFRDKMVKIYHTKDNRYELHFFLKSKLVNTVTLETRLDALNCAIGFIKSEE